MADLGIVTVNGQEYRYKLGVAIAENDTHFVIGLTISNTINPIVVIGGDNLQDALDNWADDVTLGHMIICEPCEPCQDNDHDNCYCVLAGNESTPIDTDIITVLGQAEKLIDFTSYDYNEAQLKDMIKRWADCGSGGFVLSGLNGRYQITDYPMWRGYLRPDGWQAFSIGQLGKITYISECNEVERFYYDHSPILPSGWLGLRKNTRHNGIVYNVGDTIAYTLAGEYVGNDYHLNISLGGEQRGKITAIHGRFEPMSNWEWITIIIVIDDLYELELMKEYTL